jgi:hypothetical protein
VNATAPVGHELLFQILGIDLAPDSSQTLDRLRYVTCSCACCKIGISYSKPLYAEMSQKYCDDKMAKEVEDAITIVREYLVGLYSVEVHY